MSALVGMAALAAWALRPLERRGFDHAPPEPAPAVLAAVAAASPAPLPMDAFHAPIWVAPPPLPAPPETPAAPEPVKTAALPPPLRVELLGIARAVSGAPRAVLYLVDEDRVLVVAAGEAVGALARVEAIEPARVHLCDAAGVRVLALEPVTEDTP